MPHKFNAARRHKFPKKRYRVTNWAEYTEILRRRGDLTIWVTDDTLKQWRAPRRTTPGGQPKYSNIAIETCLTLRTIYKLPLRQTQGLMRQRAARASRAEALFRTCKYRPDWPTKGFATKADAPAWVKSFASWYNGTHLHSAIRFVTPNARHEHRSADGSRHSGAGFLGRSPTGSA